MGVAQASFTPIRGGALDIIGWQVQWTLTTTNPTGEVIGSPIGDVGGVGAAGLGQLAQDADKSVQVEGTFGVGATLSLVGSNTGIAAQFHTLTSPTGTSGTPGPVQFTTASGPGLMAITEAVIQIQPSLAGGDGTTNLVVTLFLRKTASFP